MNEIETLREFITASSGLGRMSYQEVKEYVVDELSLSLTPEMCDIIYHQWDYQRKELISNNNSGMEKILNRMDEKLGTLNELKKLDSINNELKDLNSKYTKLEDTLDGLRDNINTSILARDFQPSHSEPRLQPIQGIPSGQGIRSGDYFPSRDDIIEF